MFWVDLVNWFTQDIGDGKESQLNFELLFYVYLLCVSVSFIFGYFGLFSPLVSKIWTPTQIKISIDFVMKR